MAPSQRDAACNELVSTEEAYVETLQTVVTVFLEPLRKWAAEEGDASAAAGRSGGVTSDEVRVLFGQVETLLEVNSSLLKELKICQESDGDLAGNLALKMAMWAGGPLRMYAPHVAKFPAVCALLTRLLEKRPRFKAAVRVLELQPACKGLTLQALLVNTVQRLPRYTLLLKEMIKHTSADAGSAGGDVRKTLNLALEKILAVVSGVRAAAICMPPTSTHKRRLAHSMSTCFLLSHPSLSLLRASLFATHTKKHTGQPARRRLRGPRARLQNLPRGPQARRPRRRVTHDIKRGQLDEAPALAVGYWQRAAAE